MTIKAIHNHILFQFLDRVNFKGQFEKETSPSGIILQSNFDDSAKEARWAKVLTCGPEVSKELTEPGCEILIENLMWTPGVKFQGETIWRTDEDKVLCYRY